METILLTGNTPWPKTSSRRIQWFEACLEIPLNRCQITMADHAGMYLCILESHRVGSGTMLWVQRAMARLLFIGRAKGERTSRSSASKALSMGKQKERSGNRNRNLSNHHDWLRELSPASLPASIRVKRSSHKYLPITLQQHFPDQQEKSVFGAMGLSLPTIIHKKKMISGLQQRGSPVPRSILRHQRIYSLIRLLVACEPISGRWTEVAR